MFAGLLQLVLILAALVFIPAWSVHYWQGWLFLAVFSSSVFAISIYLMRHDPKLLERRMHRDEKQRSQKIIQGLMSIAFIAVIVVPAIDHRLGWSRTPIYVTLVGDLLVALGLLVIFLVFKESSFTEATIEVAPDQKVISTGPYAIVRHPMYAGALIMLFGVPLALGSWWGLLAIIPIKLVLLWRLLDEEKYLAKNLAGYHEYQGKVRYRLAPFIW